MVVLGNSTATKPTLQEQLTELTQQATLSAGIRRSSSNCDKTIKHRRLRPYKLGEIKVLLLENVNKVAIDLFTEAGFQVEVVPDSLPEDQLAEKLNSVHALGIRSKTVLSDSLLKEASCLLSIGCFCIGTNQVSLAAAAKRGIAVFNSPFSNSRSVAELVIGEIIALARCLGDRNSELHQGIWHKTAKNCKEIRGKVLGIVGYGHIGSQLSVLAESMGMSVIFYDILQIMPLGTARPVPSLEILLKLADFVSLHVPETEETIGLIDAAQISFMKPGGYLINASRGSVINLTAVKEAIKSKHLAGVALDVYPIEPPSNGKGVFVAEGLEQCSNVILTPHIGGSTEEAQEAIGIEVATNMIKFIELGCTIGAVNLPEIELKTNYLYSQLLGENQMECRVLNVHLNVPGVLNKINQILSEFNIDKQICDSRGNLAYVIADVRVRHEEDLTKIFEQIYRLEESMSTRIVY